MVIYAIAFWSGVEARVCCLPSGESVGEGECVFVCVCVCVCGMAISRLCSHHKQKP